MKDEVLKYLIYNEQGLNIETNFYFSTTRVSSEQDIVRLLPKILCAFHLLHFTLLHISFVNNCLHKWQWLKRYVQTVLDNLLTPRYLWRGFFCVPPGKLT
jgi:hypothetical protein